MRGKPLVDRRARERRRRRRAGIQPQPRAVRAATRDAGAPRASAEVPYAELHCHTQLQLPRRREPRRRSWPRRRSGSAWPRSPSPTTTASTAWSGSTRPRAASWSCPTVFGAELGLAGTEPRRTPDPAGEHLLVLARGAGGYARLSRPHRPGAPRRRARRASRVYDLDELAERPAGPRGGADRCRKGACPRALRDGGMDGGRHRARPAGRAVRRGQRRGRADRPRVTRSTATATTRSPRSPPRPGCRRSPPATCTTTHPARRRLATALAAVRARRSLDEMDGVAARRRDARTCAPGEEMAALFARVSGCGRDAPQLGTRTRLRPALQSRRSCRRSRCRPGTRTRRRTCGTSRTAARRSATGRARRTRTRTSRSSYELDMIERARLPRLLPGRLRHRQVLPGARTSTARAGVRRRTRRSATRCGITNVDAVRDGACCSSGSSRRSATGRPTSTSTSSPTGGRRSSSTSSRSTAGSTPPRSRTSSPTGRGRRSATSPRRSASRPASRTRGASSIDRWGA